MDSKMLIKWSYIKHSKVKNGTAITIWFVYCKCGGNIKFITAPTCSKFIDHFGALSDMLFQSHMASYGFTYIAYDFQVLTFTPGFNQIIGTIS